MDELNGENGFRIQTDTEPRCSDQKLGYSLAAIGDINGDGYDDMAIASTGDQELRTIQDIPNPVSYCVYRGRVSVLYGSGGPWPSVFKVENINGSNGFTINGRTMSSSLGISLAGAGDVNGDGYNDLVIGSAFGDTDALGEPGIYLIFGRHEFPALLDLSELDGGNGVYIHGDLESNSTFSHFRLGNTSSGIGDLNADGFDDIYLGYGKIGTSSGLIIYGKPTNTWASEIDITSLGFGECTRLVNGFIDFRQYPSGLSDINKDGIDDFCIGFPFIRGSADEQEVGMVYVIYGSQGGLNLEYNLDALDGSSGYRIRGEEARADLGAVGPAFDANSDGLSDVLLGEFGLPPNFTGRASLILGCPENLCPFEVLSSISQVFSHQFIGADVRDNFGRGLTSLGFDEKGLPLLVFGAAGADHPNVTVGAKGAGAIYVLRFDQTGMDSPFSMAELDSLPNSIGVRLDGIELNDEFGGNASSLDFFGGNALDLLTVANAADDDSGEVYLVHGFDSPTSLTLKRYIAPGDVPRAGVGVIGNSSQSSPLSRFWIKFGSGDNGSGAASLMTVTIHRNLNGLSNLPGPAANVHWIGEWDRPGWDGAGVLVKYLDSEVAGLDPARLRLYYSEDADGPWTEAQFPYVNTRAKRIGGTIWSEGYYVLIEKPLTHGDVDGNGAVTPEDAQRAFLCAIGACPPDASTTASDFCPAPDGDGVVSPADAQGIYNAYMGLAACP